MKALLVLILTTTFSVSAFADKGVSQFQDSADRRDDFIVSLATDPLVYFVGMPSLGVNVFLGDYVSAGLFGSILISDDVIVAAVGTNRPEDFSVKGSSFGLGVVVGIQNSIKKNTWYVAPTLEKLSLSVDDSLTRLRGEAEVTLGRLLVGYQWVGRSGFFLRLGAGLSSPIDEKYTVVDTTGFGTLDEEDLESINSSLAIEAKVGFAF